MPNNTVNELICFAFFFFLSFSVALRHPSLGVMVLSYT